MYNAAKAYLKTQVTTTSQADVLLLLYSGAIKYLHLAKERIQTRDVAQKGIFLSKALAVLNELQSSLNKEKGGDLAANLSKLYFYCNTRLLMANLRMDVKPVEEVIGILEGLRSAFEQIKNGANTEATIQPEAATTRGAQHLAGVAACQEPTEAQRPPLVLPTVTPKPCASKPAGVMNSARVAALYGANRS